MSIDNAEAWQNAQGYAALLGTIPSTFSSVVRALGLEHDKSEQVSQATSYLAIRLIRSQAIFSPLFFASQQFLRSRVEDMGHLTPTDLIQIYKPIDLAVLLSYIYLFRRARKLCSEEEWSHLVDPLEKAVDIGFFVGQAIDRIGIHRSIMVSSLQFFAISTFLLHDRKGFTEYRRQLKNSYWQFNPIFEESRWGCTSAQIASVILQHFSYGPIITNAYALASEDSPLQITPSDLRPDIQAFQIARHWVKSLGKNGKIPEMTHLASFYPNHPALEELLKNVAAVNAGGSKFRWLSKLKDDITPEKAPAYFKEIRSMYGREEDPADEDLLDPS